MALKTKFKSRVPNTKIPEVIIPEILWMEHFRIGQWTHPNIKEIIKKSVKNKSLYAGYRHADEEITENFLSKDFEKEKYTYTGPGGYMGNILRLYFSDMNKSDFGDSTTMVVALYTKKDYKLMERYYWNKGHQTKTPEKEECSECGRKLTEKQRELRSYNGPNNKKVTYTLCHNTIEEEKMKNEITSSLISGIVYQIAEDFWCPDGENQFCFSDFGQKLNNKVDFWSGNISCSLISPDLGINYDGEDLIDGFDT